MKKESSILKRVNKNKMKICSVNFSLSPLEINSDDSKVESTTPNRENPFSDIFYDFITVQQMLWKYLNSIGSIAQTTNLSNITILIYLLGNISNKNNNKNKTKNALAEATITIIYQDENEERKTEEIKLEIYNHEDIKRLNEFKIYHDTALRILHETAIQQLVNSYEKLLGDILNWHFHNNPEAAPKEKEINYSELLSFSSLEDAKKCVIDKEIEHFLKDKNTKDQLKYLKEELNADLSSHFPFLNEFKEILLRRHAIVHAGGIASREYISRVKKIKGYTIDEDIIENKIIPLPTKYIIDAWNIIYSIGVILLHLIYVNYSRSIKSKDLEDKADNLLINSAYECILNKQYKTAEIILKYASKLHLVNDESNLMVIINLAQTLLWQGDSDECKKILGSKNWNAYSSLFQLCTAALLDDEIKFKKLLPIVTSDEKLSLVELLEWPVFKLMREKANFKNYIKDIFGEEIDTVTDILKPKLLDLEPKDTINAIIEYTKNDNSLDSTLEC